MSITPGHIFGWKKEEELAGPISKLLGGTLRKFDDRYSKWDFETDDYVIELKSRLAPLTEDSYETWLVPLHKTTAITKQLVIFYYFQQTNALFCIFHDYEEFKKFKVVKNRNGQDTLQIPKSFWTKVEI
jgi:hypothetical protein